VGAAALSPFATWAQASPEARSTLTNFGIRGTFLDFIDDPWRHVGRESEAARFHADGLLVVKEGRIASAHIMRSPLGTQGWSSRPSATG